MYFLQYIRYFLYLAWHWNSRLAAFMIWHEIQGEKKYGIRTTGIDNLKSSVPKDALVHASIYQPVNFYTAEKLFAQLTPTDNAGSLLDAGCGQGRVLAMAASKGFKSIYGFDISQELCHQAMDLATEVISRNPGIDIEIDCCNADSYQIADNTTVIFLFNPFDRYVMESFAPQVMQSLRSRPRGLKILYANPVCKDTWLNLGFREVFHFKKLTYLEGSVLEFMPA